MGRSQKKGQARHAFLRGMQLGTDLRVMGRQGHFRVLDLATSSGRIVVRKPADDWQKVGDSLQRAIVKHKQA